MKLNRLYLSIEGCTNCLFYHIILVDAPHPGCEPLPRYVGNIIIIYIYIFPFVRSDHHPIVSGAVVSKRNPGSWNPPSFVPHYEHSQY